MKSVKSILDLDLIKVDWKNIININRNKFGDQSENKESNEELSFLFV